MNRKIPVLAAALLAVLSAVLLIRSRLSGEYQAGVMLREFYTVSRERDEKALIDQGLPALYQQRMGDRLTESGFTDLMQVGIPYSYLFQAFEPPLHHSYMKKRELTAVERTGEEELYQYRVEVDFYLDKELNPLFPIQEYRFEGTICMERSGWFSWRVKGFTSKVAE